MASWRNSLFRISLWAVILAATTACATLMSFGKFVTLSTPTAQTIADCPVSKAQVLHFADKSMEGLNWGNDEGTLFTVLWPDGTVIFKPGGPGEISVDGSLSMKWAWFRHNIKGQVVVEGHRLDAPAPPLRAIIGCCYGNKTAAPDCCYSDTGFTPSAVIFPSAGCWQVTGRVNEHQLTFVTFVLKFDR